MANYTPLQAIIVDSWKIVKYADCETVLRALKTLSDAGADRHALLKKPAPPLAGETLNILQLAKLSTSGWRGSPPAAGGAPPEIFEAVTAMFTAEELEEFFAAEAAWETAEAAREKALKERTPEEVAADAIPLPPTLNQIMGDLFAGNLRLLDRFIAAELADHRFEGLPNLGPVTALQLCVAVGGHTLAQAPPDPPPDYYKALNNVLLAVDMLAGGGADRHVLLDPSKCSPGIMPTDLPPMNLVVLAKFFKVPEELLAKVQGVFTAEELAEMPQDAPVIEYSKERPDPNFPSKMRRVRPIDLLDDVVGEQSLIDDMIAAGHVDYRWYYQWNCDGVGEITSELTSLQLIVHKSGELGLLPDGTPAIVDRWQTRWKEGVEELIAAGEIELNYEKPIAAIQKLMNAGADRFRYWQQGDIGYDDEDPPMRNVVEIADLSAPKAVSAALREMFTPEEMERLASRSDVSRATADLIF